METEVSMHRKLRTVWSFVCRRCFTLLHALAAVPQREETKPCVSGMVVTLRQKAWKC